MPQIFNFKTSYNAWTMVQQFLPNPDIVLKRRGQSIVIYRELLSDSHLAAVLDSRSSATLGHDWVIDRNDCPARPFKAIENWFFNILERKSSVDDLSREEMIENLMDVVYWGYQPAELVWGFEGGFWLPMQIVPKPPEWFQWYITNTGVPELRFLSQANPIDGQRPPDEYTLICPRIKPSYENPYGRGVAGRCFWPVVFKRAGMEFWLNFMERFAMPWVVGKMNSTDTTALTQFTTDLKSLVQDAVIAISGTDKTIEMLEAKNSKEAGFDVLCNFMDAQMSKTVLGHTLSTDASDKGSYAATRGAMSVRTDIGVRDTKMIKAIINDVINLILIRNGFTNVSRPSARPFHENEVELERASRDEAVNRVGVRFSKEYFMRVYGYEEGDITEVIDPIQAAADLAEKNAARAAEVAEKQAARDAELAKANQTTGIKPGKETSNTPGGLKNKTKTGEK